MMKFDGHITKEVWVRLVEKAKETGIEGEHEVDAVMRTVGCSKYDALRWYALANGPKSIKTNVYREKIQDLLFEPDEKDVSFVSRVVTSPTYWENLTPESIEVIQKAMIDGISARQRKERIAAGKKRLDEIDTEIRRLQQEREAVLKSIDL